MEYLEILKKVLGVVSDAKIPKEEIGEGKKYKWRASSVNHEPILVNGRGEAVAGAGKTEEEWKEHKEKKEQKQKKESGLGAEVDKFDADNNLDVARERVHIFKAFPEGKKFRMPNHLKPIMNRGEAQIAYILSGMAKGNDKQPFGTVWKFGKEDNEFVVIGEKGKVFYNGKWEDNMVGVAKGICHNRKHLAGDVYVPTEKAEPGKSPMEIIKKYGGEQKVKDKIEKDSSDLVKCKSRKSFDNKYSLLKQLVEACKNQGIEYNDNSIFDKVKYEKYPESICDGTIKRGEKMSFEQADTGRTNPNYKEGEQYQVNCQTCVFANELRRRGFNVEAKGNTKKAGNKSYELSGDNYAFGSMVYDEKDVKEVVCKYKKWYDKYSQAMDIMENEEEGARFFVRIGWKKTKTGHIICAEKVNGEIRMYDPQPNNVLRLLDNDEHFTNDSINHYFDAARVIHILRVDDKKINPYYLMGENAVVKGAGK